jgi:hypothetical protein
LAGELVGYAVDGDATFKTNPHPTQHRARHAMHRLAGSAKLMGGLGNGTSDTTMGIAGVGMIID